MDRRDFMLCASLPFLLPRGLWSQDTKSLERLPQDPARTLRDYCLETELTPDTAAILCPAGEDYARIAHDLSQRLAPECGGRLDVRIVAPEDRAWPPDPRHLILLGNAINHPLIFSLYVNHYTLADEYFPGDGEIVHSVHNPFGDFRNAVILGGSDARGAASAANVLLNLVQKNGPRLGFTLQSRSSRLRSDAPSAADFAYGLAKRKEQIDVGDLPDVAKDYAILYYLTGDRRWGEMFRDLHLYGIKAARDRGTWPRSLFDDDFYLFRLLTAWDLIEESPVFSNDDRRAITQLCLEASRYVSGMSYITDYFNGHFHMMNNHQTFPAISMFMANRYFSKYYGWQEFARVQPAVDAIFALHNTSWKPNDNDEGVNIRTHLHLINYSFIHGDYTYYETGRAGRLADWIVMITDNRADTMAFGDAGEYDGVYQGGRGRIQDQYCLAPLSIAAWYYQDGRYAWARDWFRKGLDWRDRLDWNQLLCRTYGWQERYGIDEWEFYLGWLYRANLKPEPPVHLLGVAVAHYDEAARVFVGAADVPREESFDKLTFRAGFDRKDEYLALEGNAAMNHSHDDANCVMRLSWKDRLWIVEGDELKQLRRYHNGIVTVRNGEHHASRLISGNAHIIDRPDQARDGDIARLKAVGTLGDWGVSQTVLPDDNGLDWERTIVWRKGEYFVVWDRLRAARDGDYSVECRWRTLGDVKLTDHEMQVEQDSETFSLAGADGSAWSLSYRDGLYEPDREDYRGYEHAKDGYQRILRQSQWGKMKPGDEMDYVNLLQVTTGKQAAQITRAVGNAARVEGRGSAVIGLGNEGATLGPLHVKARAFVVETDGVHVFGGTSVEWNGRSLWTAKTAENASVKVPDVRAALTAIATAAPAAVVPAHPSETAPTVMPIWKADLGEATSAMHATDGMIALGGKSGAVYVYDMTGSRKARFSLSSPISRVALLPPDHVAVGARDGLLALAGISGEVVWKKQFGHGIHQRPRIPSAMLFFEGDLVVGMEDESLFRFTLQGQEVWEAHAWAHAITTLAMVPLNGRPHIAVGLEYGTANLFDRNGRMVWDKGVGPVAALHAVDLLGLGQEEILCGECMGIKLLRAADGSEVWEANLGGETLDVLPVKGSDGSFDVCTASDIGQVARFQPDGSTRWRLDARAPMTAMAVGATTLALGCLSGHVQIRALSTGRLRGIADLGSPIFKLWTAGANSDRFVGATEGGTLFALTAAE